MKRHDTPDMETVLDKLIDNPVELRKVQKALRDRLDEARKDREPVKASQHFDDSEDLFDNVPV